VPGPAVADSVGRQSGTHKVVMTLRHGQRSSRAATPGASQHQPKELRVEKKPKAPPTLAEAGIDKRPHRRAIARRAPSAFARLDLAVRHRKDTTAPALLGADVPPARPEQRRSDDDAVPSLDRPFVDDRQAPVDRDDGDAVAGFPFLHGPWWYGDAALTTAAARLRRPLSADSGEAAQAFRFDGAQCSDLKPPRARSLAG
jgi:hypothetical protein